MGQMMLVTLREGIEMFLIVAIAATYLRKTGRAALLPAVRWGTATAIVASVAIGTVLAEKAVTPLSEGVLSLVAAVLVISMVIYMLKAAKHMRQDIGARLEAAAERDGRGAWIAVFLFVVLMITREGMETAFVTASLFRQTETAHFVLGAVAGLGLAALLAWGWVRYGQRVNLALFFKVTSVFLFVFSCSTRSTKGPKQTCFRSTMRTGTSPPSLTAPRANTARCLPTRWCSCPRPGSWWPRFRHARARANPA
jgi:high-affinity iron transporter